MRVSLGNASLTAQTAPSPTAKPPVPAGIGTFATTVPARGRPACREVRAGAAATTAPAHATARTQVTAAPIALFMSPPRSPRARLRPVLVEEKPIFARSRRRDPLLVVEKRLPAMRTSFHMDRRRAVSSPF